MTRRVFGPLGDGEGSATATFATAATAGCWLVAWVDGCCAGATALRRLVAGAAEGCESAAIGFAGLVDAMVKPDRCAVRRAGGFGGSSGSASATDAGAGLLLLAVSSAVAVLSLGDDLVVVSGFRSTLAPGESASADRFGGSAFLAFGAPAELSELDLLPEGEGSSAWAIPPPNPTAAQADTRNAATISRNHQ
jgi:hypothetical protein